MPIIANNLIPNTSYTRSSPLYQNAIKLPSIRDILSATNEEQIQAQPQAQLQKPPQHHLQSQYIPSYVNNAGSLTPISHPNSRQNSISSFSNYPNTSNPTIPVMVKHYDSSLDLSRRNSVPPVNPNFNVISPPTQVQQHKFIPTPISPNVDNSMLSSNSEFKTFKVNISTNPNHNIINNKMSKKICTCKNFTENGTRVPRPRNAFILFRQNLHHSIFGKDKEQLIEQGSFKTNSQVSKEIGQRWRELPADEKKYWHDLAKKEKELHKLKYPNYKYIPRKLEYALRNSSGGECPICHCRRP